MYWYHFVFGHLLHLGVIPFPLSIRKLTRGWLLFIRLDTPIPAGMNDWSIPSSVPT